MAAAMMQRTYCVLRSFRSPGKALLFRSKTKSARKKAQTIESPKDFVYFLHNHVVPLHSFEEAIEKLKVYSIEENKEPEQTVTMCMKCQGLNKEIPSFRGTLMLPKPFGVTKKVLVFAEGDEAMAAKDAGAEIVGGEELFSQVENSELEFDHCLASLDMADKIKHLQKVLREKMPHTRRGSVTDDLATAIQTFKHTRVYKTDKYGYVNTAIGMVSSL
ncbi:50S ribosomal L1 [Paramuricea clavata]|uniref:50S ribosomal L1 n=1 Tax=Paramuricea clavata TaxID=317549 RepID=A0A6S7JMK6_PARCT|nr:50S ribosomal L1 [Paramuricea clavata]